MGHVVGGGRATGTVARRAHRGEAHGGRGWHPPLPRLANGSPRLPNRALGGLYVAGGLFSLTSAVVPHGHTFNVAGALLSAVVAGLVGAAVWASPPLAELWVHVLVDLAGAVLCTGLALGGGSSLSMSSAVFLVWVALAAALFLPPRRAALQVGGISVVFSVVMALVGGPSAPAATVYVVGTACVAAVVTAYNRSELTALARTDFLTGLPNREEMYRALEVELARAGRTGVPLSVAMVDLDGFKEVNDGQGHHAGDKVLADLAGLWSQGLRPTDMVARVGGDEFVMVMPGADAVQAERLLERLRSVPTACGWSAGLAEWAPDEDVNHLLARADAALYRSKAGRTGAPGPTAG